MGNNVLFEFIDEINSKIISTEGSNKIIALKKYSWNLYFLFSFNDLYKS